MRSGPTLVAFTASHRYVTNLYPMLSIEEGVNDRRCS